MLFFNENLTEIAELLGASYRHLLRTLFDFCEKGILKKERNAYTATEEAALIKLSADLYK